MFVVVFPDSLYPPWLRQKYHGALDVQFQSAVDEPRQGYAPTPLAVPYAPQRAQSLLYRQQWDEPVQQQGDAPQGAESRPGWQPPLLRAAYHPQFGLFYFGEDASQSAPAPVADTPVPWVAQRLQQPYRPVPWLVEWNAALDVQAQSAVDEPRDGWRPRLLPLSWGILRSVYYQQQDWTSSTVEGGPAWTPLPLRLTRLPWGTPYYYYSNTAQDTSAVVVVDTPVPWVGRRLPTSWAFPYGLYQWHTAQDTSAPAPAPSLSVVERPIMFQWARRLRLMSQQRPGR